MEDRPTSFPKGSVPAALDPPEKAPTERSTDSGGCYNDGMAERVLVGMSVESERPQVNEVPRPVAGARTEPCIFPVAKGNPGA